MRRNSAGSGGTAAVAYASGEFHQPPPGARDRRAVRKQGRRPRDREGREAPHGLEMAYVAERHVGFQVEAHDRRPRLGEVREDRRSRMLAAAGRLRPRALHQRHVPDQEHRQRRPDVGTAEGIHEPLLPQPRRPVFAHVHVACGLEGAAHGDPLRRREFRHVRAAERQGRRLQRGQPPPRRVRPHTVPPGRRERA